MDRLRSYAPGEMDLIKDAYLAGSRKRLDIALSDQTWHDMNMDQVFARIDDCVSFAGQERLYAMLREPCCDEEELKRRDSLAVYFSENEELREAYREKLRDIGRDIIKPVSATLDALEEIERRGNLIHILCALFGIFSLYLVFTLPSFGLVIFILALTVNIPVYFRRKGEISEYIACFSYIIKTYRAACRMLSVKDDEEKDYRKALHAASKDLKGVARGSFVVTRGRGLTGSLLNMALDYLRIFFHIDLIKFNLMLDKVLSHREEIERMFEATGEVDSFIAVSGYRKSLPFFCVPEYTDELCLDIKTLSHPLIEKPVSSNIRAGEKGVLITGSNASGKSTFLRSVALGVILGQSIATVYAKSCKISRFHIISSMSVSDDILSGSSYYMAEIKALKRVIDKRKRISPVLCFVDEVLKGTNTIERIAASSEILKSLTGEGVICFAATHDAELTKILTEYFDNYHFEEDLLDDSMHFSYRLMTGPAVTKNAIKLLKIMGYDGSIINSAEERAKEFEDTGVWK